MIGGKLNDIGASQMRSARHGTLEKTTICGNSIHKERLNLDKVKCGLLNNRAVGFFLAFPIADREFRRLSQRMHK